MQKLIFILITFGYSFAFSATLTCDAISGSQINKVQVSYTSKQIETIDLIKDTQGEPLTAAGTTQRIYSRTYTDSSNRGGYVVSYCNPDDNEISEYSGMSIHSNCKAKNTSDDVFFTFRLNKDHNNGKISISYLGNDVLNSEFTLKSCR